MKTITIGSYSRRVGRERSVQYGEVISRVVSGSATARPQFCIELSGGDYSVSIYAASEASLTGLRRIVARGNGCIAPGPTVLGIHLHRPPGGWPHEAIGSISVRRAPESIIASASAALAEKPAPRYPFRTTPGIEIISWSPRELVKFAPYHLEDSITLQNRNVKVSFGSQNPDMVTLHVATANADLARSLAAAIAHKTPRRLMVNDAVLGISLVLVNGTKLNVGEIGSQSPTAPLANAAQLGSVSAREAKRA